MSNINSLAPNARSCHGNDGPGVASRNQDPRQGRAGGAKRGRRSIAGDRPSQLSPEPWVVRFFCFDKRLRGNPVMSDQGRRGHPSGRPINRDRVKMLGFFRRPLDEPATPGLRKTPVANAIGFTARICAEDDDE